MVVEGILNVVFGIVQGLLSLLPDIHWNVDGTFFDVFFDVLEMVCYLLPMGTVVTIFYIIVGFTIFKAVISLIRTIWELLPIV